MKTLFIDTHLGDIHIVLNDESSIIREKHIVGEKQNSRFLIPTIEEVCNNESYDQIVVVNGPGSFTGVRLGVTVAKTLAYTQNLPIKTVTSLECMCYSDENKDNIYALSDGNGYYVGHFSNFKLINDYIYVSNRDYDILVNQNKIITDVVIDVIKIIDKLKAKDYQNPHTVNPIYIKLIGVENGK